MISTAAAQYEPRGLAKGLITRRSAVAMLRRDPHV